jgi:hypothetical protein
LGPGKTEKESDNSNKSTKTNSGKKISNAAMKTSVRETQGRAHNTHVIHFQVHALCVSHHGIAIEKPIETPKKHIYNKKEKG